MLYRIILPYATFGIEVENDIVTEAPPIDKWLVGKNIVTIMSWIATKYGDITPLELEE